MAGQPPSTETTIARILFFVGAAIAGLIAAFALTGLFTMGISFLILAFGVAGMVLNLIAAASVTRNPRVAGALGVVATFFPPMNLFSLIGGILCFLSPEGKQKPAAMTGV